MKLFRIPLIPAKPVPHPLRAWPRPAAMLMSARFNFGLNKRQPFVPLTAAGMFLNLTTREILSLIESGKLAWVFNISSRNATRREVRVLRQSLLEFNGHNSHPPAPATELAEFGRIMDLILPEEIIVSPVDQRWRKTDATRRRARNFHHEMRLAPDAYRNVKLPEEPVLRGTEIAECFCCIPQHVSNLIRDQLFQAVELPRAPKASPFVTRASVIQFLKDRRMS